MALNLKNYEPRLRDRIMAQLQREDAEAARPRRAAAAGVPRLQATVTEPAAPPPLDANRKRTRKGKERSGRMYRIHFTIYSIRPMDWSNAAASIKFCEDEIVRAGWLPDGDGWQELEGSARAVKVSTKAEERTEAILTRIK